MNRFRQLFSLAKNYRLDLFMNLMFNILASVLSLFTFLAVVPFLRILFNRSAEKIEEPNPDELSTGQYLYQKMSFDLDAFIQDHGAVTTLFWMCLVIVALALLKNLFNYIALNSIASIRTGIARDLRTKIYQKVLDLPLSYYSNEKKGDVISRATNDLYEVEFSAIGAVEVLFKSPVMLIISLVTLFIMNTKMTLFALIFLPVSGFLISRVAKSLKNAARRGKDRLGQLISVLEETLSGLRIIKGFNAESEFDQKFDEHNQGYFRLMRKLYKREYLSSPMSEFISFVVIAILLYVGGSMVLNEENKMGGEVFIGYLVVFSQIIPPARSLTDAFFRIKKGGASMDRINEILLSDKSISDPDQPVSLNDFEEEICYRDVHFSYEDGTEVIKGISFSIKKGQSVALVGASGGGKSTLANLLARYYDVSGGHIELDGKDIRKYRKKDLRGLMGIVTQQSILFNDTINSNITLGSGGEANAEKVRQSADIANASEFINGLEDDYNFN
ncbi:MAG: ABC transporter ATP-binding protein, partial [Bacteroidota bacterium]